MFTASNKPCFACYRKQNLKNAYKPTLKYALATGNELLMQESTSDF